MHYLYKITCLVNQKIYIGQAENYEHRWSDHRRAVKLNKPTQTIHHAMIKHGIDNFVFEVIATCKSIDDANWTETELVKQYDSFVANNRGYNATLGGMNAPKSEEWKTQMSAIKGGWIGKDHTEENKEIFRKYHLGSTHSPETILKRSQAMKKKVEDGWMPVNIFTSETAGVWTGKSLSDEHRQAISDGNKGRFVSKETRQKISEAQIGKVISEEQRKQMSEASAGKHYSPETEFQKGMIPWNKGKQMGPSPKKGIKTGIVPPNKGQKKTLTEAQLFEINKLLSEGNSLRKIGETLGVARHFISKELKRIGS